MNTASGITAKFANIAIQIQSGILEGFSNVSYDKYRAIRTNSPNMIM